MQSKFYTEFIYPSLFLLLPLWSIGHPWNASFHFSFLILDSRYDFLDGGSAQREAATYKQDNTNTE
jgi:hypothetical protein